MKLGPISRVVAVSAVATMVAVAVLDVSATPASAASGADWDPGYIVSDSEFYNGNAMSGAQIQAFLEAQVATCHPELSAGPNDPIVCLKDYTMTTVTLPADAYCAGSYSGAANEKASTIIYKVAQACNISPKALLVTLQKEQGLVTHTWPSTYRYDMAMGFACPDTAPCDTQYFGFQNQVWRAARQFQRYKATPSSYNFRAGVPNIIGWNPNSGCGSSSVLIRNAATAGLYNYTPYQPNAAALANLYGTGDGCSSYGNRNFWRYWTDWFGSPTVPVCTVNAASDVDLFWQTQGGAGGALGAAVAPWIHLGPNGVTVGSYANGDVYCKTKVGPVTVTGDVRDELAALGGASGALGLPLAAQVPNVAGGATGVYQSFERGMVLSSVMTGTFAVLQGPIRDVWGALGGSGGSLGWPVADQVVTSSGVSQQFQHGVIAVPTGKQAIVLSGVIGTYWTSGSNATALGLPTGPLVAWTAGGVTGSYQTFDKGMVMSSTTTGTHSVLLGPIRNAWGASGGSGGSYGWPTGDQESVAGGVRQQFQNGVLTSDLGANVSAAIAAYWTAGSNANTLGTPVGSSVAWTAGGVTGSYQVFERGMVLSSVTTGTFAVLNGPLRDAWGASGGSGGSYGWPTGDQESVAGGARQQFQNAVIAVPIGKPAIAVSGAIGTYWTLSSHVASLGMPTGPSVAWTAGGVTGSYQTFDKGMVLSSVTTGTSAVLQGPIRDLWGALGGSGGSLGWPVADQVVTSSGVSQQFQHGVIAVPTGKQAIVLSGVIGTYWTSGSNATALGLPTGPLVAWTAGGVTGSYEIFDTGILMSSTTTGTFAVLNGPLRDAWGVRDGSGGPLGWPVADQVVTSSGVSQQFQHGVIAVPTGKQAIVLSGVIGTYWTSGSNATALGLPTGPLVAWTAGGVTGSYEIFDTGILMSSTTTGTFAVLNGPLRDAWGARDGSGGPLGWPIGDQETVPTGVQQQFQNGLLVAPTVGVPYVVT